MFKALMKLAVCGVVTAAISAPAFANPGMQVLLQSEAAPGVLKVLGLGAGATEAQVLAKIQALPAAEAAGVMGALNVLNEGLKTGGKNAKDVAANKKANLLLAKSIFSKNGSVLTLAALSEKYSYRAATDKVVSAPSCSKDEAADLLDNDTSLNSVEAKEALSSGLVIKSCKAGARGLLDMSKQAREVAARAVLISKSMKVGLAEGLARAKAIVLGSKTTAAEEMANVAELQGANCQVFATSLAR